jgi:hypothetical protein
MWCCQNNKEVIGKLKLLHQYIRRTNLRNYTKI